MDDWVALAGLDPAAHGTHSLRRTKVALVYKRTGNLRACQLLLGHTKLESIRVGQAVFGVQFRRSRSSALARMTSFRMTAVMATLGGFPAVTRA